ncbi:MAG: ABC transporter permease subunit [Candidatus Eisenbacteria bacterium]|nr:ABC transporter permease subunit [Candidatus Eisenbacteria bacterium]
MQFLIESLHEAVRLILAMNADLTSSLLTTLRVSLTSTSIAALISLPLAFLLARHTFPGKRAILILLRTALAFPTVAVALFVYAFIARNALLGDWQLLFTPAAIVIGQVILIVPLMSALSHAALQERIGDIYEEAILLGASPLRASWQTIVESRLAIITALATGFGRVISEVGVSLILGGNIRGVTRTMTTAIHLETSQGHFALAIALGMVLLAMVLALNLIVHAAGGRRETA